MKFRVVIEQRAAADIAAYARWVAEQGSPENALRWIEGVESAILSLSTMPARCSLAPEAKVFKLELRQRIHQSHRILFLIKGRTVHVLHVRHGARRTASPDEREES